MAGGVWTETGYTHKVTRGLTWVNTAADLKRKHFYSITVENKLLWSQNVGRVPVGLCKEYNSNQTLCGNMGLIIV
jgi:hypothetical protein